jgi:hypothetical protein
MKLIGFKRYGDTALLRRRETKQFDGETARSGGDGAITLRWILGTWAFGDEGYAL